MGKVIIFTKRLIVACIGGLGFVFLANEGGSDTWFLATKLIGIAIILAAVALHRALNLKS